MLNNAHAYNRCSGMSCLFESVNFAWPIDLVVSVQLFDISFVQKRKDKLQKQIVQACSLCVCFFFL